jgi:uncharacterized protein (UPF0335 family)
VEELLKTLIQKIDRLTDMVADMQRDINDINDIKRHGRDTVSDMVATRSSKTTNAERCRKYREKKKAAASGSAPCRDMVASSEGPLLTSFLPSESLKGKTAARARGKSRANKTEFPVDWEPELKFDEGREFAKFKASALAHGRVYVNWPQAWANWKLNAPNFNRSGSNGRRHGSVLDAFDRIGERLVAAGASEDYVPGSSGPRPLQLDQELRPANPRLISSR